MAANEDSGSAERLVGDCPEPEPRASACRGSPKWRIASLVFGLAIGTAFTVYSRRGKSLAAFDSHGITMLAASDSVEIPIIVRDFKESHPDFERSDKGLHKGLVKAAIGADRKPVYVGGVTMESAASFKQWFNDDATNKKISKMLTLKKNGAGKFEADLPGYFPIDGEGWNDKIAHAGTHHNYFFTLELHHRFKYTGGETFTFRGDDDIWVFINDKLVIDLGGTHVALEDSIDLDTLGLEAGKAYTLDLFFAERHTFDSNFRIETTIALDEAVDASLDSGDDDKCCLIAAINFLCFEEKQFWTIWC